MYIKKVQYLERALSHEAGVAKTDCAGAIITSTLRIASSSRDRDENSLMLPVGTPCIIYHPPFLYSTPTSVSKTYYRKHKYVPRNSKLVFDSMDAVEESAPWRDDPYADPFMEKGRSSAAMQKLYNIAEEKGLTEANDVLKYSLNSVSVLFPIVPWVIDQRDHFFHTIRTNQVYFNGTLPLIYDEAKRLSISRLRDVHGKNDIKNFPDLILEFLKKYRYINYVFEELSQSNAIGIQTDLDAIYSSLNKSFPRNTCFSQRGLNTGTRNVVSVSFYRLDDIIPIFDKRHSRGVGMEILITNTKIDEGLLMMKHAQSSTYRFLFASSRENVFTIDGEPIERPNDKPSFDIMSKVNYIIAEHSERRVNQSSAKSKV